MWRRKLDGTGGCELETFRGLNMLEFTQRLHVGEHSISEMILSRRRQMSAGTWAGCFCFSVKSGQSPTRTLGSGECLHVLTVKDTTSNLAWRVINEMSRTCAGNPIVARLDKVRGVRYQRRLKWCHST